MNQGTVKLATTALLAALALSGPAQAATLPPHRPLRILIVSDEVNPHGLPPEQLTQPGELSAALSLASSGLNLATGPDALVEIPTDSIEQATALLQAPPGSPSGYDVLVYFAHRIPNGNDGPIRQEAFSEAVRVFLERGGGLVSFHHGIYVTTGKESMQFLMGAAAFGSVVWDTFDGQNVIATAPDHFVACQSVTYEGTRNYEDLPRTVPLDDYPFFNNTPDERYPQFDFMNSTEEIEILFGSDDALTSHLLGYTHRRQGWNGLVVVYQPGEHQPTALDPNGPNFQILVNAIVYASHRVPRDGIDLRVNPSGLTDTLSLSWSACPGTFTVHRSTDPTAVGTPGTQLTTTTSTSSNDTPPPGGSFYYRVLRN